MINLQRTWASSAIYDALRGLGRLSMANCRYARQWNLLRLCFLTPNTQATTPELLLN